MLTHLHHGHPVSSPQHRWARDAVIAAHVGVAALVVVTAFEQLKGHEQLSSNSSGAGTEQPFEVVAGGRAGVSLPPPAGEGTTGGGANVASGAAGPTEASSPASIEISLLHGGERAQAVAVDPVLGPLLGPLRVDVLGAGNTKVASTEVVVDQVARVPGLPAGVYRLVLSQQSQPSEPSPGVGISAANAQITDPIELAEGDILLIALLTPTGAAPTS